MPESALTVHSTDAPQPADGSVSVVTLNEAGKVRVTWSRPTLGPGQVITGYSVQYRRRGTISYTTHSVPGSNTTSYTITNLNLGTVYEVGVASVGPLGLSGYCCRSGKQVTTYNCEWTAKLMQYKPIDGGDSDDSGSLLYTSDNTIIGTVQFVCLILVPLCLVVCKNVRIGWHTTWYSV